MACISSALITVNLGQLVCKQCAAILDIGCPPINRAITLGLTQNLHDSFRKDILCHFIKPRLQRICVHTQKFCTEVTHRNYFLKKGLVTLLNSTPLFCVLVKGELIWNTELTNKRTAGMVRAAN